MKKSGVDMILMIRTANEFLTISSNNKTFIPNFVNEAFACELYLKAILQDKTGDYPKGRDWHNLEKLYDKVIENIDEEKFLVILNKEIEKTFPDYGTHKAKRDLYEMFDEYKNLFEDWRYLFEEKNKKKYITDAGGVLVVDNLISNFAVALKEYVEKFITKGATK